MNDFSEEEPLLMIPGPVQSSREVLEATARRAYSHTESSFVSGFQSALENLRGVFEASDGHSPVVVAGGGTLAMEIAMVNLVDAAQQQQALVCETGYFGDRFVTLADSLGVSSSTLSAPPGEAITEEKLDSQLSSGDYDFAFIQHVDTSTGVANDIEMFAEVCSTYDVVSVVDGVCALGGEELRQARWGVDIYLTGAQKALALPPGLAVLMYSPKAREISEGRQQKIPSYYADLENWWPIMDSYDEGSVSYFSTPATNMIMGLQKATQLMLEEGMDNVYSRHQRLAQRFREGMTRLGFDFITADDCRASTLSTPKYLDADQGAEFRKRMLKQGVLVAGGIQSGLADQYFRVGHMGNVSDAEIDFVLDAVEEAIK